MRAATGLGLGCCFLVLAITFASNARAVSSDSPDMRELSRLRSAGRLDEADVVAQRLRADPKAATYVASYELYDRGRCEDAAALLPSAMGKSLSEGDLRFDIEICRAARMDAHDPAAAESLLGHATMLGDEFGMRAFGSFGRFARAMDPDLAILQFLQRKGLDRDPWSRTSAMHVHLFRLNTVAVIRLLESGVDPNLSSASDQVLPLQVVRSRSWRDEAAAIATARALIDHGADPNMLAWYRDAKGHPGAKGTPAFEAVLAEAAARLDPVRVDFVGAIDLKVGSHERRPALRIRIGNASASPVPLDLWQAGDQLECGLHTVEFEYRPPHFEKWLQPVRPIEDGPSPAGIEIAPGDAREFLCEIDAPKALPGSEIRLVVWFTDGSKRYSPAFHLDERWAKAVDIPDVEGWK